MQNTIYDTLEADGDLIVVIPATSINAAEYLILAAQGAGKKIYITAIDISVTAAGVVKITDGSAGTTIWNGYFAANAARQIPPEQIGRNCNTTANTGLYVAALTSATIQGTIRYRLIK